MSTPLRPMATTSRASSMVDHRPSTASCGRPAGPALRVVTTVLQDTRGCQYFVLTYAHTYERLTGHPDVRSTSPADGLRSCRLGAPEPAVEPPVRAPEEESVAAAPT